MTSLAGKTDTTTDRKAALKAKLKDQWWRLNNLYKIVDKEGRVITFKPNAAQKYLYDNLHTYNVILKARQLGFSTFIMIFMLDMCLFNRNYRAGVITETLPKAEELFANKVKFAYDNLPPWLKAAFPAKEDSARKISFPNGSSVYIDKSMRGGTLQLLHVSEYGKISARYPANAREIKTGALNTVYPGQLIFIESTAEGRSGEFYEVCQRAIKLKEEKAHLTSMDPKIFFFPWFQDPGYTLHGQDVTHTSLTKENMDYFELLGLQHGVQLTPGQKAWYVKKLAEQHDDMKREYPSTPAEAFERSMEGAYYHNQMSFLRMNGRITNVPHDPKHPVYTFWDLGVNDYTSIWFMQYIENQTRIIDYEEAHGEGWDYFATLLQRKGYVYGRHTWPHDGQKRIQGREVRTSKQIAESVGIVPISIVPRTSDVSYDINNYCRPKLIQCWFDKANCSRGIDHLDNYRKEWDDRLGCWKDKPLHDESSNAADAFRTLAKSFDSLSFAPGTGSMSEQAFSTPTQASYDDDPYGLIGGH